MDLELQDRIKAARGVYDPDWNEPAPSFSQRDPGAFLLLLYVGLLTGLFALGFALGRVSVYLL